MKAGSAIARAPNGTAPLFRVQNPEVAARSPAFGKAAAGGQLGQGDSTLAAWVRTAPDTEDVLGDILTQFDPVRRRGFNFGLQASAGGYSSHGDDRHVSGGSVPARPTLLPGGSAMSGCIGPGWART